MGNKMATGVIGVAQAVRAGRGQRRHVPTGCAEAQLGCDCECSSSDGMTSEAVSDESREVLSDAEAADDKAHLPDAAPLRTQIAPWSSYAPLEAEAIPRPHRGARVTFSETTDVMECDSVQTVFGPEGTGPHDAPIAADAASPREGGAGMAFPAPPPAGANMVRWVLFVDGLVQEVATYYVVAAPHPELRSCVRAH
eukprot:TRINITY_DN5093_c0_g2_i1.p1 TRINITY_DN5093_c0_g2~~TRINITY_DN5093_c0_g2_i1.p1  ORF type:complete len:196 (+),score=39.35 TRINITY_DN5093_c0_g2_i1:64-651(+)